MNTPLITDYFPEEAVRACTRGRCHDFALALHRRTGWAIGCLWLLPYDDDFAIFKEPAPVHVFIQTPDGRGLDVEGLSPLAEMTRKYAREGREYRTGFYPDEASWTRSLAETTLESNHSLMPREAGIAETDRLIAGSQSFLRLVSGILADNPKGEP